MVKNMVPWERLCHKEYTNQIWKLYLKWFESLMAKAKAFVYTANANTDSDADADAMAMTLTHRTFALAR